MSTNVKDKITPAPARSALAMSAGPAHTVEELAATLADGRLTPEEREDLLRSLRRMLKEASEIEPALRRDRP